MLTMATPFVPTKVRNELSDFNQVSLWISPDGTIDEVDAHGNETEILGKLARGYVRVSLINHDATFHWKPPFGGAAGVRMNDVLESLRPQMVTSYTVGGGMSSDTSSNPRAQMAFLRSRNRSVAASKHGSVVSPQKYSDALHAAMAGHPNAGFVTYYSPQEIQSRGMTPILENDGQTGCLIIRHGGDIECAGLFSVAGSGTGLALLQRTIQQYGVNYVEAFEGLDAVYKRLGFKEVSSTPWNDDYAPSSWDYASHGRPSVKVMKL